MNNSDFFLDPVNTVQFLSVFSHINTLSDFLYSEHLLARSDQFKPIPIVNSLFEYFDKNNDSVEIKMDLVHQLLDGSDLYGAKKTESIDANYVDAMFNYITGNIVFQKFGNIYGFLVDTVLSTDIVTLPLFKEKVNTNLRSSNYTNEDGSVSQLSDLAASKICEKIIFPLFPKVEGNISIFSPDYLYAQAGLSFLRFAKVDLRNASFDELIEISLTIELSVHEGQMNSSALNIFSLSAMLYYANTNKDLSREMIGYIINDFNNWISAYAHLFRYLYSTFNNLQQTFNSAKKKSPVYQFKLGMSHYKTLTQLAEENIRLHCPLEKESDYKREIDKYKYGPANYYCWDKRTLLPNVNDIFDTQNKEITQKYFLMENQLIHDAFGESAISSIDNMRVIIFQNQAQSTLINVSTSNGWFHQMHTQHIKESADLLEIFTPSKNRSSYLALNREDGRIIRITDDDRDYLCEKLGIEQDSVFKRSGRTFKNSSETFFTFATRVARARADVFNQILHKNGYQETSSENAKKIILSLIPFYSCRKWIISKIYLIGGQYRVSDCTLDVSGLFPVFRNLLFINSNLSTRTLLATFGTSVRTLFFVESILMALRSVGEGVLTRVATEYVHMLTRQILESTVFSFPPALHSGLEVLGEYGILSSIRLLSLIGRRLSSLLSTRILMSLSKLKSLFTSIQIGKFGGHDVYVNSLSGTNGFGRKYISTAFGNFELWKALGVSMEIPVRLLNNNGLYERVNLITGKRYGIELKLIEDILQPVDLLLSQRMKTMSKARIYFKPLSGVDRSILRRENGNRLQQAIRNLTSCNIDREEAQKTLREYILEEGGVMELFVLYWKNNHALPPWRSYLKVDEPDLLWKLRYEELLVPYQMTVEEANTKIEKLYANHTKTNFSIDMVDTVECFNVFDLYSYLEFEELYAISHYVQEGFTRIHYETDDARRMQNAFYRLAVRQADMSLRLPKVLYFVEKRYVAIANSFTNGSVIEINRFTALTVNETRTFSFLGCDQQNDVQKIPIIYKIELDSSFLQLIYSTFIPSLKENGF